MPINSFKITRDTNFGQRTLIVGIAGLLLSLVGFFVDRGHFFHSYLIAYIFWLTIGLGALFFTMLHHLVNSVWSVVLRRISENIMSVLPFMALFVIPILLGIGDLYHWSHAEVVAENPVIRGKVAYLNVPFFILRAVLYFVIWIFLVKRLYTLSVSQDAGFEETRLIRMRRISALGMVFFAFSITFASFDWLMSLKATWYSTAFGVYIFAGSVLSCLAFLSLTVIYLQSRGLLRDAITKEHYHDLGKLLFTFVVFWGYIAFAQYFLIWYANIPEETVWYKMRWGGWWQFVTLLIVFGHFVFPFLMLISRGAKRSIPVMTFMGFWLLFIHWVDIYWIVMPNHPERVLEMIWIDIATMVGMGGMFLWYFRRRMVSNALVPINEPNLETSIQFQSD